MIPVHVNGRYRLKEQIGSGAYGNVYHASDIIGDGDVVVKLQCITGITTSLEHEYNVLRQLGDTVGISHVHWFGWEDNYDALVLDRLGQSLESVFKAYQHSFSRNTIVFIAYQLVCRLQYIHSKHFIHCDLKPNNILIRTGKDAHKIYLVDFGISKQYRYPCTHLHIAFEQTTSLTGTPAFASINSHAGMELGRSGISDKQVVEMRCDTTKLCQDLPEEVEQILTYSRSLSFDQKSDYTFLCCLLQHINRASEFYHAPPLTVV
ncbi:casein kinase I isoform delta [Suillus subluteus]|nr:casein kinase I isoform delta [Suillus subluteus]